MLYLQHVIICPLRIDNRNVLMRTVLSDPAIYMVELTFLERQEVQRYVLRNIGLGEQRYAGLLQDICFREVC